MGQKKIPRAALFGALCLPILPALAQDTDGVRMFLGVSQRFEYGDNLALSSPEEGSSSIATTRLSFGLESETERQVINLGLSGGLTIQDTPDTDGTETELGTPRLTLSYGLVGSNARLDLDALYRTDFVDTLTFQDFVNQDGILVLPEDFAGLDGTGKRTNYGLDARLQLGTSAPLGFDLTGGLSGTNYSNTTDPDLTDFSRTYVGADALFRISPVLTAIAGLRYSTYDSDDSTQTYRTTTTGDVGVNYDISARARLEARIGVTEIVTDENGAQVSTTSSPVGSLDLVYDMPDGAATLALDARVDADTGDQRTDLVIGRSYDRPDGAFAFTFGLTDPEAGSIEPIGSLIWERNLPAARLSARIDRRVSSSNQDETRLSTLLALGYDQDINEVSGFSLDFTYGETDATATTNKVRRSGLSASYRHALTRDWDLNTGINYRVRDEDGQDQSDSPSIFLTIGRQYEF